MKLNELNLFARLIIINQVKQFNMYAKQIFIITETFYRLYPRIYKKGYLCLFHLTLHCGVP